MIYGCITNPTQLHVYGTWRLMYSCEVTYTSFCWRKGTRHNASIQCKRSLRVRGHALNWGSEVNVTSGNRSKVGQKAAYLATADSVMALHAQQQPPHTHLLTGTISTGKPGKRLISRKKEKLLNNENRSLWQGSYFHWQLYCTRKMYRFVAGNVHSQFFYNTFFLFSQ